jgi:hypothetical protein
VYVGKREKGAHSLVQPKGHCKVPRASKRAEIERKRPSAKKRPVRKQRLPLTLRRHEIYTETVLV